jgi:hypothetical protein
VDDGARARPGGGLSVLGGVTHTDRDAFDRTLSSLRALDARRVLSSHLPPTAGMADQLIGNLSRVPGSTPWVGPDQAALDQLLASVTG